MNELQLRQSVVETARSYLGVQKGSAKHTELVNLYNTIRPLPRGYSLKTSDDWCAGFVSAIARKCDVLSIIPAEVSCYYMIEGLKKLDAWMENDAYVPSIGDIILYDWQDDGKGENKNSPDHVGLVVSVSNGMITAIEGNAGSPAQVRYRTLAVNGRYIRGFGVPKYATIASKVEKAAVATVSTATPKGAQIQVDGVWGSVTTSKAQEVFGTTKDGIVSQQFLSYKSQNKGLTSGWQFVQYPKKGGSELVRAMQKWLGVYEDGYFGTETIKALQRKMGTPVDGHLDNPSTCVKAFQRYLNAR